MAFERLTHEDARILGLEEGSVRGHTCKVLVLGEHPGSERIGIGDLRRHVERRLGRVPRLRQRLARTPLGIAEPIWVDDHEFDVARHVRRVPTRSPVGRERLRSIVGDLMATRLDPARPLWRLDLVDPLEEGGSALVVRLHHCMADGAASVRILSGLLLDSEPDADIPPPEDWRPAAAPGTARLAALAARDRLGEAACVAAGAARALASPGAWAASARTAARLPATIRRELAGRSAESALAAPIGPRRVVAFESVALEDVKRIGKTIGEGVTVNDVVLAAIGGGLRRLLAADLAGGAAGLRVKVPVSLHGRDDAAGTLANRDSFMFVDLPLAEEDPVERLLAINRETSDRKRQHDAETLDSLFRDLSHVSHSLERLANRWAMSPHVFTLNVSNVPGPRGPTFVMGAPLREAYSLAEVASRHALRASVFSASGSLAFGFCADAEAVPDLDPMAAGVADELEALRARI